MIGRAAGILLAYPALNIEVGGYTDTVGSDGMNQTCRRIVQDPSAITWFSREC
jgi:hypothetical protein